MNILLVLFSVSLVAGVSVILMAFFAIKRAARQPANGELKRLKKIDEDLEAHKRLIKTHLQKTTASDRRYRYESGR